MSVLVVLTDLPVELIQHILSFLPDHDAYNAICVSPYITMPRCDLQRRRWERLGLISLAAAGDLAGVKYLYLRRHHHNSPPRYGAWRHLDHLLSSSFKQTARIARWNAAVSAACNNGHVPVVQYLHDVAGAQINESDWHSAITNGHFALVEYMHRELGFHSISKNVITHVCFEGRTDIVTFLHDRGLWPLGSPQYNAMDFASWKGHLPLVKLLHNMGEVCTIYAIDSAALEGHLDVVQYLHGIGAGCTIEGLEGAYYKKHMAVVDFLKTLFETSVVKNAHNFFVS